MTLIAFNVATFLIGFATLHAASPLGWMVFTNVTWPAYFWTLVTWPLVTPLLDPFGLLLGGLLAYWIGGSLERAWGSRVFFLFLAATAAITALTLWIGGIVLDRVVAVHGLWLAIAAPTVAWCAINAREVIRLYAAIPITAPQLALLTVALTWFQVSRSGGHPLLGLFALSGCAAAYWYAREGRYALQGYGRPRRSSGGEPPLRFRDFDREPAAPRGGGLKRWLDDRRQRRELEKLLRRSGFSDPDENRRR